MLSRLFQDYKLESVYFAIRDRIIDLLDLLLLLHGPPHVAADDELHWSFELISDISRCT